MTLIVGMKSRDCIVVGAEQEESTGITAKHSVTKLKLLTGGDWALVVGGAGDGALAEGGMRELERRISGSKTLDQQKILNTIDTILDDLYTKYIDKDPHSQGVAFVIGAVCGNQLHLISTAKRVPQVQDSKAYVGYGEDIAVFFMDRLHSGDDSWMYDATVAGFVLEQATQACQGCSGPSEIYVLQRPPNPRWRFLGNGDAPVEFSNEFQFGSVSDHLRKFVEKNVFISELTDGYSDEWHPKPLDRDDFRIIFPLEFFPSSWLKSSSYRKQIDEICTRNRDKLCQLGLLSGQSSSQKKASSPIPGEVGETSSPQQEAKEQKSLDRNSGK